MIEYLFEYVDSLDIRNVIVGLLKQNRSIKDIEFIYQKIADYSRFSTDVTEITGKIKDDIDKLAEAGKNLI